MNNDAPISQTGPDEIAQSLPKTTAADLEVIRRAREIMASRGHNARTLSTLEAAADYMADEIGDAPPQPPGRKVRIAVVVTEQYFVYSMCRDRSVKSDEEALRCAANGVGDITHKAIITAVIPPVAVPVVEGRVET